MVDLLLRVGAHDETRDSWAKAKLGTFVSGRACSRPVRLIGCGHVIVPSTPVIPGNDNGGAGPERTIRHIQHPLRGPLSALMDGLGARVFAITKRRIQPADFG